LLEKNAGASTWKTDPKTGQDTEDGKLVATTSPDLVVIQTVAYRDEQKRKDPEDRLEDF